MTKLSELPNIFKSKTIKPSFKEVHVLLALIVFNQDRNENGIGRYRLQEELCLTEGKVRSLLNRMKHLNLIKTDSRISGHVITDDGKEMLNDLFEKISPPQQPSFDYKELSLGKHAYFSIVFQAQDKLTTGIEQRDEVIKIGGTGATCLIYNGKQFNFPNDDKEIRVKIPTANLAQPLNEGDVLIIGTGEDNSTARLSTLVAAISLIDLY
ncbi:MAG: DUF4443 domain-containing protein [Candidatus Lokiarchaeota archaeon]|nr:DUF4443 domain-containing protein [Candidatus Lokiarchaeota archaeon]